MQMTAVLLPRFGGPEVLTTEKVSRPVPAADEILVRIVATSVNQIDYKTRAGELADFDKRPFPYILGRDVAGTVEKVGSDVRDWRPGDAIYARPGLDRGTYAEYIAVKPNELAAAPKAIPLADAGAVPLAALTGWQGLMRYGDLKRGQRVLIHGGAGGVGHLAVQFARAKGATVFATCSGRDKAFVKELGAEAAIDYRAERFEDVATDIDLVLDLVGGETQRRSWAVLKRGGIIVSPTEKVDEERARAAGARPGKYYFVAASGAELAEVASLIDAGQVRVVISARYPLSRVGEAQVALEKGGARGKLLVTVAADV